MTRDDLLTRAQLALGQVHDVEEALARALDQLDRERDRGRSWDWLPVCAARVAVLQGVHTTSQAARRLGVTPKTLRTRWTRLGMPDMPLTLGAAVRGVIESRPGVTDSQIAAELRERGYLHASRVSVMRTRQAAGLPSSYVRRIAAERDEVDAYLRAYPWMTAGDIRGAMRADGWPWAVDARRIASHVEVWRAAAGIS